MKNETFIATSTVLLLIVGIFLFTIRSVFATEQNDITQTLRRTIMVNPEDPKANLRVDDVINQLKEPPGCSEKSRDTFCMVKTMKVNFEIEYVTERVSFEDINDADAWQFGKYYPDEPLESDLVTRSDTEAVTLIQKSLYERGLLDIQPTGKLGNKTISALMDLAWLKKMPVKVFQDLDKFRVTKDILKEVLGLKQRMAADPGYLQKHPLPPINWQPGDTGQLEKGHQKKLIQMAKKSTDGGPAGVPRFDLGSRGKAKASGNVNVEIE